MNDHTTSSLGLAARLHAWLQELARTRRIFVNKQQAACCMAFEVLTCRCPAEKVVSTSTGGCLHYRLALRLWRELVRTGLLKPVRTWDEDEQEPRWGKHAVDRGYVLPPEVLALLEPKSSPPTSKPAPPPKPRRTPTRITTELLEDVTRLRELGLGADGIAGELHLGVEVTKVLMGWATAQRLERRGQPRREIAAELGVSLGALTTLLGKRRHRSRPGMRWCTQCKEERPKSEFGSQTWGLCKQHTRRSSERRPLRAHEADVVRLAENGASRTEIAHTFGVNPTAVSRFLIARGF